MRKAVFITAYNRLPYLQQVLHSWQSVRGLEDWHFVAMIEPSPVQEQVKEEFELFAAQNGLTDYEILINPERFGVLHHPWVGFERLFNDEGYDFVVRAEDDLVVSSDILEMFDWSAHRYESVEQVAAVNGFSITDGREGQVSLSPKFSPLNWGTWRGRWNDLLRDTWDHDYSTFNGVKGNQAGWDWNINTRVLPEAGMLCVVPDQSRVQNIGMHGTHAVPEDFIQAGNFSSFRPKVKFYEAKRLRPIVLI